MTVKVIPYTFSGSVVQNGTFTVGYPAGFTKGSFAEGKIRKIIVNGTTLSSPVGFTVTFGATSATVTYLGATPIASGAPATIEFDIPGEQVLSSGFAHLAIGAVNKLMPAMVDFGSPLLAVTTAFINGATGAGQLPNNNTIAYKVATVGTAPQNGSNTTWQNDVPRNLTMTVTHGSSIVATTANITGTDIYGVVMRETLAVTATGTSKTATGLKAWNTITEIDLVATTDSTANTVSIGFGSALGLPTYVGSIREVIGEVQDGVPLAGDTLAPVRMPFALEQVPLLAGTSIELVAPVAGIINTLYTVVRSAVTTGGTVVVDIGTTAVTGLSNTVANSATKGTAATSTSSALNVVAKGGRIQILPASFATAGSLDGYIEIQPTDLRSGSLAPGLSPNTTPTATTADVRGTYTPAATMDGTIGFILMLLLANPTYLGSPQY